MSSVSPGEGRGEVIWGMVAAMLARKGRPPLQKRDNLLDAGLSSLDVVNLMLAVEDTFDLTLPQEKMTPENFRSIDTIEALVVSLVQI
jgi:acyl carrier protein